MNTRRAHPLYRVPRELTRTQDMFRDAGGCLEFTRGGDLLVYSTPLDPDMNIPGLEAEEYCLDTISDLAPAYTPTAEEVMRALRGPRGYTGPMGPGGEPCTCRKDETG